MTKSPAVLALPPQECEIDEEAGLGHASNAFLETHGGKQES